MKLPMGVRYVCALERIAKALNVAPCDRVQAPPSFEVYRLTRRQTRRI
jgi:hypothetical protein